jgi:lipopolysaccharide transport system ATP-binding protein
MSSEVAIEVREAGKCFHLYGSPQDRLKELARSTFWRWGNGREKHYFKEFWAVKPLSFSVRRGETVGIIGRNGSGKSTLLQMICGTLTPTTGHLRTTGRLAALLELGSGFNPEFSGRENVFLNAALLGLTESEIKDRFDDIVRFAEIGAFIDEPVKTYSSGMMVRLAFAVQSQIDPDILVVDEALAVGDARFQAKCFDRLNKLREAGTSILLVTHSSEQIVTHCDRALLLDAGQMLAIGSPRTVVNKYLDLLFSREQPASTALAAAKPAVDGASVPDVPAGAEAFGSGLDDLFHTRPNYNPSEYRWGDRSVSILDFALSAGKTRYPSAVENGDPLRLQLRILPHHDIERAVIGFTVKNKEGVTLYATNTESGLERQMQLRLRAGEVMNSTLEFECRLGAGDYFVSVGVASRQGDNVVPHDRRYDSIHLHVVPQGHFHGLIDLDATIRTSLI